jgi:hypothetical protein
VKGYKRRLPELKAATGETSFRGENENYNNTETGTIKRQSE